MTMKRFEGNEFAIQVISKGAFIDNGTVNGSAYLVEATTIRLNHIALNAWILSETMNCRECYETDEEWEAHKAEYVERRKTWITNILEALKLEVDSNEESVSITQSQSEVFTVVHISKISC